MLVTEGVSATVNKTLVNFELCDDRHGCMEACPADIVPTLLSDKRRSRIVRRWSGELRVLAKRYCFMSVVSGLLHRCNNTCDTIVNIGTLCRLNSCHRNQKHTKSIASLESRAKLRRCSSYAISFCLEHPSNSLLDPSLRCDNSCMGTIHVHGYIDGTLLSFAEYAESIDLPNVYINNCSAIFKTPMCEATDVGKAG